MDYISIAQQHVADLYPIISYNKPRVMDLPPGAILGTWQYSVPNHIRYILAPEMELATGVLPGDVARSWIKDEYKLPIRLRRSQLERYHSVPLRAIRGEHGDCSYIDIEKAYVHILSMGYNVEYKPGKYIMSDPRPVPDQIIANKMCYALAVSMSASKLSNITVMGKDHTFNHRPMNMFSNPCLFALAQDTLNGVAADVLSALGDKVVYMNTDGFIVKAEWEHDAMEVIRSWGFKCRIKASGETTVYGVASYKCGTKETARHDRHAQDWTSPLMEKQDFVWLRDKWQRWNSALTSLYKPEQNSYKFKPSGLLPTYYDVK